MIRIISGNPGKGKTLLAIYFMFLDTCVNGYDNYIKSCKEIAKLNSNGFHFSYPQEKHVTYFNGEARLAPLGRVVKHPYIFNPWRMGVPTGENDVSLFFPGSKIYIDEAQRYYNSRLSYCFPDFVSRFYELHRHWKLDITLIAQRAGLIDLNIREIAQEFLYVEDLDVEEDSLGNLIKATWAVRKFTNNADLEHYLDGKKDLGEEVIIECTENLFKFYDTEFYKFLFLNKRSNQDFLQQLLRPYKLTPEICDKLSEIYSAVPPKEYYNKEDKKKSACA